MCGGCLAVIVNKPPNGNLSTTSGLIEESVIEHLKSCRRVAQILEKS